MQHPHNALDKFKSCVHAQLSQFGVSVEWWQEGEQFIMFVRSPTTNIKVTLRFYPEFYAMETEFGGQISRASAYRFKATLRDKLDECVYIL